MQALRHYLLAVQFFTRIPVTGRLADWVGYSPAMLRASAAHFPGVGVIVGMLVAGLTALLLAYHRTEGAAADLLAGAGVRPGVLDGLDPAVHGADERAQGVATARAARRVAFSRRFMKNSWYSTGW